MKIDLFVKTIEFKFKTYIFTHGSSLLFIFVTGLLLYFLSGLPYFNILFSSGVSLMIIWIIAVIFLKLSANVSFLISLILIIIALAISIFRNDAMAEQIGNMVYFLLLTGFLQTFFIYIKEQKHDQ